MAGTSFNIIPFIEWLAEWIENHRIAELPCGAFSRYSGRWVNAYGCADVVCIKYTLGEEYHLLKTRESRVRILQDFQNPATGLMEEESHHCYHTTAYIIAALQLLDARPRYPVKGMDVYKSTSSQKQFLDGLDWTHIWHQSHQPAGIASIFAITRAVNREWFESFFNWLDKEVDPQSGLWRRGVSAEITQQLGGAFHFYFVYQHLHWPLPYPERIIDTVLGAQRKDGTFHDSPFPCWLELDAIYELNRALRQTGYRRRDILEAMKRTLGKIVERVMDSKYRDETMDDTHAMVAILSVLAELQQTLPGYLVTPRPLRLVLDRRPFI